MVRSCGEVVEEEGGEDQDVETVRLSRLPVLPEGARHAGGEGSRVREDLRRLAQAGAEVARLLASEPIWQGPGRGGRGRGHLRLDDHQRVPGGRVPPAPDD